VFTALRLRARLRLERWARRRQGMDDTPLVLRARRLYILPTRTGLAAGAALFVMLVAGLNYANSLALLLTFVLAGYVLVGMHECQRSLRGLELVRIAASECHAGLAGTLELHFENTAGGARRALSARASPEPAAGFDLPSRSELTVPVAHRCLRRGRQRIGRIELASTAPFGLFRCWTWLHLPLEVIAYPRPLGARALPPPLAGGASPLATHAASGEDEWASLRGFQAGDNPRSIAWKAYARGAPLMVSLYAGVTGTERCLDLSGLEALDLEAQLSQLAVWVEECERSGCRYALRLPGVDLPLGRGQEHRRHALCALALYGEETRD
jgi:uncharacterized protein (DUF58 family)